MGSSPPSTASNLLFLSSRTPLLTNYRLEGLDERVIEVYRGVGALMARHISVLKAFKTLHGPLFPSCCIP
jgi:hypothetical protein